MGGRLAPEAAAPGEEAEPLARLYGEPLREIPRDLYIPPDALQLLLETFEGPLDLLLYLIRKQNFNILDIPMSEVTQQYMRYVEEIRSRNLELAAEYLLMAAMLMEIKSRMLLPRPPGVEGEADIEEDPRAELVRRLLQYEQMQHAAQHLARLPQHGRDFWLAHAAPPDPAQRLAQVSAAELVEALAALARRARLVQHHQITPEALSVRECMGQLLKALRGQRFAEWGQLLPPQPSRAVLVVTFVALLELAREALVELTQGAAFAPLYVRLGYLPEPHAIHASSDEPEGAQQEGAQ